MSITFQGTGLWSGDTVVKKASSHLGVNVMAHNSITWNTYVLS